jgi:hypothetical protein
MSWIVRAENMGAFATLTSLTIVADAGTLIGDVAPSQGTCTTSGLTVTCQLGVLAAGSTASVTLDALIDRAGPHQLTAAVSTDAATVDAVAANDVAVLLITISPAPSGSPAPSASAAQPGGGLPDTAGRTGAAVGVGGLAAILIVSLAVLGIGRARRRSV